MEIQAISWRIKNRLVPGQPEGETSTVWNGILHEVFPPRENYATGPEMLFGSGKADLFTAHLVFEPRAHEKKFIIIECKAPGEATRTSTWEEGADQLHGYLATIPVRSQQRRFGAIAIGKTVRFYEFANGQLFDYKNDGSIRYLDRQCQDITTILKEIKSTV